MITLNFKPGIALTEMRSAFLHQFIIQLSPSVLHHHVRKMFLLTTNRFNERFFVLTSLFY